MSETEVQKQAEISGIDEKADRDFPWMIKGTVSTKTDGTCNVLVIVPHLYPARDRNSERLGAYLAKALDSYAVINNGKYRKQNRDGSNEAKYKIFDLDNAHKFFYASNEYGDRILALTQKITELSQCKVLLCLFIDCVADTTDQKPNVLVCKGKYDERNASSSHAFFEELVDKLVEQRIGITIEDQIDPSNYYKLPACLFRMGESLKADIEAVRLKFRFKGYRDSDENMRNTADKLARAIQSMSSFKSWRKEEMGADALANTEAVKDVQGQNEEYVAPLEPEIIDVGASAVVTQKTTTYEESSQIPPDDLALQEAIGHDTEVGITSPEEFQAQVDALRQSTTIKNDDGKEVPFEGETKEEFIKLYEAGYPVAKKMAETIFETGSFLFAVREVLKPKKLFLTWMKLTGFPQRSSYRELKVYERYGDRLSEFSYLGIRKLLAAAKLPNCAEYLEAHKEDVAKQTVDEFEQTIRRLRASKKKGGRGRKPKYEEVAGFKVRRSEDGTKITVEGLSKESQDELFEAIKALLLKENG